MRRAPPAPIGSGNSASILPGCPFSLTSLFNGLSPLLKIIAAVQQFIQETETVMAAVGRLTSQNRTGASSSAPDNGAPPTFTGRVLEVFKMAGRPLRQKEATEQYRQLGWPEHDAKDLYGKISGAIAYLHKKKATLEKNTDGTYKLKP